MRKKSLKVGIIGGGIGGLTLMRALLQRGIDAHLFERTSEFREVGAGIQITPNGTKVLLKLGLEKHLKNTGFLPESMVGRSWDTAEELFRTPLREACQRLFGSYFYHIHRVDLHSMLAMDLPADRVTLNAQCVGIEESESGATAEFADGSKFTADVIVGADGIHSVIRRDLWGDTPAEYTGHMCWRALVPVPNHPLPFVSPDASFWLGPKAHIVTYYIRSGNMVNLAAISENPDWVTESWTEPSTKEELIAGFEGWNSDIITLFEQTEPNSVYKWGLFDRDPMPRWSKGGFTLLGDAAHPMLPFLSQGASMAIEDAYVLATALDHFDDTEMAFAAYEAERAPRTARVQLEARERGRTYHLSTPEELRKRNLEMQRQQAENPNAVGIKAEWVYEYDATRCAERFNIETADLAAHTAQ